MTIFRKMWAEDELKILRDMWIGGASASAISLALPGRSRNSILGVVYRSKNFPKRLVTFFRTRPARTVAAKPVSLPPEVLLPASPPIGTMDLLDEHCRWPYDVPGQFDFIYCGRKLREHSSYCPGHSLIAFQPIQERKKRVR